MSTALILVLLALSPNFVISYNVDTSYPVVYTAPDSGESSYFGFSVALSSLNVSASNELFVGAPRHSNEEGSVYRCRPETPCTRLNVDASAPVRLRNIRTRDCNVTIVSRGWLGASIAVGERSELRACAPRSLITTSCSNLGPNYPDYSYVHDMRGLCYDLPNARPGVILYRDDEILYTDKFPIQGQINALYGFSMGYTAKKDSGTAGRIIGMPRHNVVEVKEQSRLKEWPLDMNQVAGLGYSVASGYFSKPQKQLFYAAGAPSYTSTGLVMIYILGWRTHLVTIHGSVFGEYFGASLAIGDFNGDGFDDIAVGAPHWGEVDFGRVYTYNVVYRQGQQNFKKGLRLQGEAMKGQFGYTLAAADLDNDGYSDLIVSAPWEGLGVVYIFYGHVDFKRHDATPRNIQRIEPSAFLPQVQRFGFALSHPVDIDQNGYPDLAIGAYKSGHAVVLYSKPVITVKLTRFADPATLVKTTPSFVVSLCVVYDGKWVAETQEVWFDMLVDVDHKRIEGGSSQSFGASFSRNKLSCANKTLTLKPEILNSLSPIVIHVKHSIRKDSGKNRFCSFCPVLSKTDFVDRTPLRVPFRTGCKVEACSSRLSLTASFEGTNKDNEWVVGSKDIKLHIMVTNEGDPAYLTQVIIDIPYGILLGSAIESCLEEKKKNTLTLTCDIDDPLTEGPGKLLSIDLDMGHIEKPADDLVVTFNITRTTLSVDQGYNNPTKLNLTIMNDAYVTLTGVTDKESQEYGRTENKTTIPIRHTYQVLKFGATPITEAHLTIDVPTAMVGSNDSYLNISVPKLVDSSGNTHECTLIKAENSPWTSNHGNQAHGVLQRRRREIAGDSGSNAQAEQEADSGPGNNDSQPKLAVAGGQTSDKTIYLNCTTPGISCSTFKCVFSLSKKSDDIGNVALDMVFNTDAVHTSKDEFLTFKFNTNASVKIIWPFKDPTFYRNTTADASTMLYNVPEPQKLAGWILPSSIILGILLFCILAVILFRVGFFKRTKKAEIAKAKETEMILKADNAEE